MGMMHMGKNNDLQYIPDFGANQMDGAGNKFGQDDLLMRNNKKASDLLEDRCDDQQDMDKSDTICGRKRTFKNTKMRNSNSVRKQGNNSKDADTLIVPDSIENFKATKQSQN